MGRVVVGNSGHDRGLFSVIVKITPENVSGDSHGKEIRYYIADGRRRKISNPKAKNRRHFTLVNCRFYGDVSTATDKDLRRLLHKYNFGKGV